jgi:SWIB/MDM2 domain
MASDASMLMIDKEEEDEKPERMNDPKNVNANDASSTMLLLLQQFRQRMDRLDALEETLQHRCRQARRRMQLRLLQEPPESTEARRSHVRLSIHHSYQPEITAAGAMAALMQKPVLGGNPSLPCKPSPPIWTCHVEGKLLIDCLDYASAKRWDQDDLDPAISGVTKPLQFTHLFHKVSVTFQTIFEHLDPKGGGFKAKKKSRRTSNAATDLPSEEPSDVCKSALRSIVWNTPTGNSNDTGADLWSFAYPEPSNPDKTKWKVQSVVAVLELHRRYQYHSTVKSSETTALPESPRAYYRITSSALQKALFPHHGPVTTDVLTGAVLPTSAHAAGIMEHLLASPHNQVHIPSVLTMTDIIMTFFTYIQDNRLILMDHGAGDVVQCDKTLQNLFHMEQFSFSQLRSLLQQRQLIEPASTPSIYDPVRITYIMEQEGASPSLVPSAYNTRTPKPADASLPPSCLQLDMDIWVPTQFHSRAAALLRRCLPRESEALAARSAARVRLSATVGAPRRNADDDPWVRSRMEQWLQRGSEPGSVDAIPCIPLALAKAARPGSEAQRVYQCDALVDYWMQQLEQCQVPFAQQASSAARALQQCTGSTTS